MKLFFALLVSLCLHHSMQGQVQRPRMIVDGNHGMTTLEHLISGESGHGDDDRNYLKINVNGGTKSFIMEESGLFVIGSEDLCLRHHDNVHLSVKGVAIKTDDPLWATPADENHKMYLTPLGNSVDDFMNINFYSYKSEESAPLRYGVLAQQVMPYFPHSIDHFLDDTGIHYTFNPNNLFYSGMKVIQENRQQLDDLETQLQNLETQLQAKQATNDQLAAELEAIKAALADAGIDIPVTPASELESRSATPDDSNLKNAAPRLKQNIPNPFQKSTSIPYYLPSNTQQAALIIHDMTGKTVLQQTLPNQEGEGKVEIDLSNSKLKGGIYTYSLYVNKQLIDTKKLSLLIK